jgi:hypothetical protein
VRHHDFEFWLERIYKTSATEPMARKARQSCISNCHHVEEFEGDLDDHYKGDQMASLLRRFEYGPEEEARNISPRHRVPIDCDRYMGTAILKSAISLYAEFCRSWPKGSGTRSR